MQRHNNQSGGTPYPFRYFNSAGSVPCHFGLSDEAPAFGLGVYNTCGQAGGATSLPPAWYNPQAGPGLSGSKPGCNLDGNPLDFIPMLYRGDYAVKTALQCAKETMAPSQQMGGAFGAPFFIPNYGRNPNQTSGQMDAESQVTNGFSYRFETPPSCTPFCTQWGNNLPSFNKINRF